MRPALRLSAPALVAIALPLAAEVENRAGLVGRQMAATPPPAAANCRPWATAGLERGGSLLLGRNLDGWGELTLGEVGGIGALADEGRDHLLVDLPDAVVGLWELWFEHLEVSPSGKWSVRHLSPG